MKRVIKLVRNKVYPYNVMQDVLDAAVERGLNRYDKYSEISLEQPQRELLKREIDNSFWMYLEEEGIELK